MQEVNSKNLTFIFLDEVPEYKIHSNNNETSLLINNINFDRKYSDIICHLFGQYVLIDNNETGIFNNSSNKYVNNDGIVFSSFTYHASSGNPETSIIGRKDELIQLNNSKNNIEEKIKKVNMLIITTFVNVLTTQLLDFLRG